MGLPLEKTFPSTAAPAPAPQAAPGFKSPQIKIKPKGIAAKNLALTAAQLLSDPIIRALPDNPYSSTYIRQQAAREQQMDALSRGDIDGAAAVEMPRGIFADQIDAVTKPVIDFIQPPKRGLQPGDDIPFDQYPAGVPRPDGKINVDGRPLLSIPDSVSE